MPLPHPQPSEVFNQPPALEGVNRFAGDLPLREAVERHGGAAINDAANRLGAWAGSAEAIEQGRLANANPPRLRTHDRFGNRIDRVDFHPAYHELMRLGIEVGVHALPWEGSRHGHVERLALMYLRHQVDEGTSCPLTMTFAVMPSLRAEPALEAIWAPRVVSRRYDPRFVPAEQKSGALFGMAMTERQGGSDVRANTTRAARDGEHAGVATYRLTGHKWFCSAPMNDAFLVLAQTEGGLTCFLVPRFLPDGGVNAIRIERLKEKLGNHSNASSEITFDGTWAQRVGEKGRGVATIIEMVRHTRLDCALGSAATLRRAVAEAIHHAAHRSAFGARLVEQPLMTNVLADLALESEAATALAFRLGEAFDRAAGDARERALARIATAIAKYWIGKRAVAGVAEALEVLGGNGYVEEGPLARLYRDVPLNSIWEGSGNVQCLDVLRAAAREPETREAVMEELIAARGADHRYDARLERIHAAWSEGTALEARARRLVEDLAVALQASLLLRHGPANVADAFCAARLEEPGACFGTLPAGIPMKEIVERHHLREP